MDPLRLAITFILSGCVASCGGGNGVMSGVAPSLRVVDAAFNAPYGFDILLNSATIATNLTFGQSTALQPLASNSAPTVQFDATGTTSMVLTVSSPVQNGSNYSVLAIEGVAGLEARVVTQSLITIPADQARLTLVHAASAIGTLDFFVTGPADTLPAAPSIGALSYAATGTGLNEGSLTVAAGQMRIRAIIDGDATRTVVFDSGSLSFTAAEDVLLLVVPASGSAASFSLLAIPTGLNPYPVYDQRVLVRFGNFAPALQPVDAFLDASGEANSASTLEASNIGYTAASGYVVVAPAAYVASIAPTGQFTSLINPASNFTLSPASAVSLFAIGISGSKAPYGLQIAAFADELVAPAPANAGLRIIQASPDLGAVDVVLIDTSGATPVIVQTLASPLPYAGATTYITLPAATYTLALVPTGAATPLLPAANGTTGVALTLNSASLTTLVAAGCRNPNTTACASTHALQLVPLQD